MGYAEYAPQQGAAPAQQGAAAYSDPYAAAAQPAVAMQQPSYADYGAQPSYGAYQSVQQPAQVGLQVSMTTPS